MSHFDVVNIRTVGCESITERLKRRLLLPPNENTRYDTSLLIALCVFLSIIRSCTHQYMIAGPRRILAAARVLFVGRHRIPLPFSVFFSYLSL